MNIIEQHIVGKHSSQTCEDGIATSPHFVAVVDGSTSKTPRRINPLMTNGRYAMTLICEAIARMPADVALHEFCSELTAAVAVHYPSATVDTAKDNSDTAVIPPALRLCASVAIYSRAHRQVWLVGDCQCMINGQLYTNGKPYEEALARKRAAIFEECLRRHPDMVDSGHIVHDYARDHILPQLIEAMAQHNKGYAVIDGYPIFEQGIRVVQLPEEETEVVLATDGYPHLLPTLQESEVALSEQLSKDPFCIATFPATKGLMVGNVSFDDRAYLRFTD